MEKNNKEKELENWLFNNPEKFESGIRWISQQRKVFWHGARIGSTDLQGVDASGNMVIIELKAVTLNHRDISQALCYWVSISKHSSCKNPRLVIVGPNISTRFSIVYDLMKEISDIDLEVYLYEKIDDGYDLIKYEKEKASAFFIKNDI